METKDRTKIAEGRAVGALLQLFDETRLLFHCMKAVAVLVHRQGKETAGRRGVLRDLSKLGPLTVPQLARMRPVSRQHIQVIVNALRRDHLVEIAPNPSHRRSALIRLTDRGRKLLEVMKKREVSALAELRIPVARSKIEEAAGVLTTVREALGSAAIMSDRAGFRKTKRRK